MSLVGPRPFVVYEADQITGWARRRLDMTPGITGLWQVLGRNDIPFDEMVKLDYLYVTNWSLWWDLKILAPDDPGRARQAGCVLISARVPAARLRSRSRSIPLTAESVAVAACVLAIVLLAALSWATWGDLSSDTGYDASAGFRIAHGAVPYADFTYFYGPLAPAVVGLGTWLFGSGIGVSIAIGLLITAAILAATFTFARIISGVVAACVATTITAAIAFVPDNYSYVLPHTNAATLGTLFVLCLLLALWKYADGRAGWALTVAGAFLGLTALTKPEPAAAALAAVVVWFAVRGRGRGGLRRELALVALPAVAIPAAVYAWLLTRVSAHALLFDNLYPREQLKAGGDVLVKVRMPLTAHSVVWISERLVLYVLGTAALLVAARVLTRSDRLRRPMIAGLVLVGLAVAAISVANPEALRHYLQFVWAWVPAGAIIALVVLLRRRWRKGSPSAVELLEVSAVAALAVCAFTSYGGFYLNAPNPQMAVYYVPLAAAFLVHLHLRELARTRAAYALGLAWVVFVAAAGVGLTLHDAHAKSAVVSGPGGSLSAKPAEASLDNRALAWIARTKPGEPVLVAPIMTGLYVLSGHQSPLRQISLTPSELPTAAAQREAISSLEGAHVRLVITDRRAWADYGQGAFGGTFDRILGTWIRTHFHHQTTLRSRGLESRALDVWTRRLP